MIRATEPSRLSREDLSMEDEQQLAVLAPSNSLMVGVITRVPDFNCVTSRA